MRLFKIKRNKDGMWNGFNRKGTFFVGAPGRFTIGFPKGSKIPKNFIIK